MANQYISTVVRCAGPNCDHVRQECNHWYICHLTDRFLLKPWDDGAVFQEDNILPLCGDECASKMLAKFMSDLKSKGGQQS